MYFTNGDIVERRIVSKIDQATKVILSLIPDSAIINLVKKMMVENPARLQPSNTDGFDVSDGTCTNSREYLFQTVYDALSRVYGIDP